MYVYVCKNVCMCVPGILIIDIILKRHLVLSRVEIVSSSNHLGQPHTNPPTFQRKYADGSGVHMSQTHRQSFILYIKPQQIHIYCKMHRDSITSICVFAWYFSYFG